MTNRGLALGTLAVALLSAGCGGGDGNNRQATAPANDASESGSRDSGDQTVGQLLAGDAQLSSFAAAVKGAGLEPTLTGAAPYTLFAPSNAAFARLPPETAQSKAGMNAILIGHIVPGMVTASDLKAAIKRRGGKIEIATVGGGSLTATEEGDAIVLHDAKGGAARVVESDRLGANGAVHVIDGVLMPR